MATQHDNGSTFTPQAGAPTNIGNEDSNPTGLAAIHAYISNTDDRVLHHTTFDFGGKVMALTLQGIILADTRETDDDDNPSVYGTSYSELFGVEDTGHDREIKLIFRDGKDATFRMGNAQTVVQLKNLLRTYQSNVLSHGDPQLWTSDDDDYDEVDDNPDIEAPGIAERVRLVVQLINLLRTYQSNVLSPGDPQLWTADDDDYDEVDDNPDIEAPGIAERVRFWEEQDRINQALIPRVIRQGELLTEHVAEHDDLPQLVGRVVADALAEQARQYDAALEEATARLNDVHAQALQATNAQYEAALEEATAQLNATHVQALHAANAEQEKRYESATCKVQREAQRTRNRLIAVSAGAVAVGVAAVIIAVLV